MELDVQVELEVKIEVEVSMCNGVAKCSVVMWGIFSVYEYMGQSSWRLNDARVISQL